MNKLGLGKKTTQTTLTKRLNQQSLEYL